jgi:hypothetical protein
VPSEHRPIAELHFTDGVVRPVFEDADGGQYVVDTGGERVKGVWILADEPLIARGLRTPSSV